MTTQPDVPLGVSDDDLDRRAAAGAAGVAQATMAVDVPTSESQRRRQRRQNRVFGTVVVALLVMPLTALALVHRPAGSSQEAVPATTTTVPDPSTTNVPDPSVHTEESLKSVTLLPGGATDGKGSKGFPVDVTPFTALTDHQAVTVTGHGFPASTQLGVLMCTSEAAEGGGIDFCDISTVVYVDSDATGSFSTPFNVARLFRTTAGARDCAEGNVDPAQFQAMRDADQHPSLRQPGAWTCIVAAGAVSDYDQSGGFPVTFAPGPPPTLPPVPTVPRTAAENVPYSVPSLAAPPTTLDAGGRVVVPPVNPPGTTSAPAPSPSGTTPVDPSGASPTLAPGHCC